MLLTPHVLAGMTFGNFSDNYVFSGVLGAFSYLAMELIPHWDPENKNRKLVRLIRQIDFILAPSATLVVIFFKLLELEGQNGASYSFILGGVVAMVIYMSIYFAPVDRSSKSLLAKIKYAHSRIKSTDRTIWGILIQVSVCILSITILFALIEFPTMDKIREQFGLSENIVDVRDI